MSATENQELAELRRVCAELQKERDAAQTEVQARSADLAQRDSEYGERIEQQAATINVLKAMSASPGDPQPVFDLIVRRSAELCSAPVAGLFEYDASWSMFERSMTSNRRGRLRHWKQPGTNSPCRQRVPPLTAGRFWTGA
jgi:hypothetical protein